VVVVVDSAAAMVARVWRIPRRGPAGLRV